MNENLKIRMIRDPRHEPHAGFIAIDDFDSINPKDDYDKGREYYLSSQIFKIDNGEQVSKNEFFFSKETRDIGGTLTPLRVHSTDTFSLPSAEGYLLFGAALRARGIVYNKKKCQLTKMHSK